MMNFLKLFLLAPLLLLPCFTAMGESLRAGAARVSIVPPFPTPMGGFTDRTENFTGVRDELFARALVIDDGKTRLAIVGSDLMALDRQLVERARAEIEKATGIRAENIMISCSHNHSAPYGYQRLPKGETNEILDFMVRQFARAAIDANAALAPARLGFGSGELAGASRNRQQDNHYVDEQVGVLRVERPETREIVAILFNYTAHPVILGSRNLELSGEFPGAAERTVESVMGGVAMFTQGACGDVTINRSGDPWLEIERVGRMLAGEVIKTAEQIKCSDQPQLAVAEAVISVAGRRLPPLPQAEAELERARHDLARAKENDASRAILKAMEQRMRLLEGNVARVKAVAEGKAENPERVEARVQVMQIGDLVLAAIPGEIFVEYALELRDRIRQEMGLSTILVGYANDYLGYIITPRAIETGGYEAAVARVDENAGRKMIETAMALARSLQSPANRAAGTE